MTRNLQDRTVCKRDSLLIAITIVQLSQICSVVRAQVLKNISRSIERLEKRILGIKRQADGNPNNSAMNSNISLLDHAALHINDESVVYVVVSEACVCGVDVACINLLNVRHNVVLAAEVLQTRNTSCQRLPVFNRTAVSVPRR